MMAANRRARPARALLFGRIPAPEDRSDPASSVGP